MTLFKPNTEKLKTNKNIKGLSKLLSHKDVKLRLEAVNALGEIQDNRAVEPLIRTIQNKTELPKVKEKTVKAIENIGGKRAISYLLILASGIAPYPECKEVARDSLERIGKRSVDKLTCQMGKMYFYDDINQRKWSPPTSDEVRITIINILGKIGDRKAVSPLLALLQTKDTSVRSKNEKKEIIKALGEIGDMEAVDLLVEALKENNKIIPPLTAEVLDRIGWIPEDPEEKAYYLIAKRKIDDLPSLGISINHLLVHAIKYAEIDPYKAAEVLASMENPSIESLTRLYKEDTKIQEFIISASEKLKASEAVEYLIEKLPDGKTIKTANMEIVNKAIDALSSIGKPSVNPLITAIKSEDKILKLYAQKALSRVKDKKAIIILLEAKFDSDDGVSKAASDALITMGVKAVDILIKALESENEKVRKGSIITLGRIGDKKATKPLTGMLKDKNEKVRWSSVVALGEIGDREAISPLIEVFDDSSSWVRDYVSASLKKMGKYAVEPLIGVLKHKKDNVRKLAIETLGKIGGKEVVGPIIKALKEDKSLMVKQAAEDTLGILHPEHPRAINSIIKYLFNNPKPARYSIKVYKEILLKLIPYSQLTEELVNLIIDASTYERKPYKPEEISDKATVKLCRLISPISSNILHLISQKKDFTDNYTQYNEDADVGGSYDIKLDFQKQRALALKELGGRSNPPYDSGLYLKTNLQD